MTRKDKWLVGFMVAAWLGIFLCVASFAYGANPKLSVGVDAQGYATIKADLPSGTKYNWQVLEIGGSKKLVCLLWIDGQRAKMAVYDYAFTDYQAGPTPNPEPEPQPIPPVPVGKLWIVVVEESSQLTPAQGKVLNSKEIADFIQSKGHHKPWIYDKDAKDELGKQPAQLKEYAVRAKSLPFLFLVSEAGSVVWEGALPSSEAQVLELLKKYGG